MSAELRFDPFGSSDIRLIALVGDRSPRYLGDSFVFGIERRGGLYVDIEDGVRGGVGIDDSEDLFGL
jgi:hypothetical protein